MTTSKRSRPPRTKRSSTTRAPAMPFPMTASRSLFIGPDADRAHLEFRHAADWIERVVRQPVCRPVTGPVKRHEYGVRTDVSGDPACERRRASPRSKNHFCAIYDSVARCDLRVDFGERLRRGLDELRN